MQPFNEPSDYASFDINMMNLLSPSDTCIYIKKRRTVIRIRGGGDLYKDGPHELLRRINDTSLYIKKMNC